MNFMDLKRLMIITRKTALEILEIVYDAKEQLHRRPKHSDKDNVSAVEPRNSSVDDDDSRTDED